MGNRFVAVDVETANPDLSSICQIGLVLFDEGRIAWTWESLVDPEDFFYGWNVAIHGITPERVEGQPTFASLYPHIRDSLTGQVLVCHTAFDRAAFARAAEKYGLPNLECSWLDSARVARRAWPEMFARGGYGLANCAATLGIEFTHHAAGEDARAAGEVVLRAIEHTGLNLDEWFARVRKPISGHYPSKRVDRTGNPDGVLAGECVVFTGALSITRNEAADLAAAAGCDVASGVTKATTLLVVGDQDYGRLAGHSKSNKHRKAEELIEKGQPIRILGESDFHKMVSTEDH